METIWSCFFVSGCQIPHTQTAFPAPALFSQCGVGAVEREALRCVAVPVAVPGVQVVEYGQGRRFPWAVVQDRLAGFVLMRNLEESTPVHSIAEFFILRKYRRRGMGKAAAHQIFGMFPGQWRVAQTEDNHPAVRIALRLNIRFSAVSLGRFVKKCTIIQF
jgi:hypothetical protein